MAGQGSLLREAGRQWAAAPGPRWALRGSLTVTLINPFGLLSLLRFRGLVTSSERRERRVLRGEDVLVANQVQKNVFQKRQAPVRQVKIEEAALEGTGEYAQVGARCLPRCLACIQ